MDASEDFGESQATQLLQDVLATGERVIKPNNFIVMQDHVVIDGHKENPGDLIFTKSSMPQYNLHGLGQTQTQLVEDSEMEDAPQNSNLLVSREGREQHRPPSPPQSPPPSLSKRGTRVNGQGLQTPSRAQQITRTNKLVPDQYPRLYIVAQSHTSGPLPETPNRRPAVRSTHALSPDLAEDDFDQDSYIAQAAQRRDLRSLKQFQVPLSDLENGACDRTSPGESVEPGPSMFTRTPAKRRRVSSSPPPQGTILVDATPEHSVGSQTQPLINVPTQIEFLAQTPDLFEAQQRTYYSDTESDDYGKLLEHDGTDEMEPTQPATEPDDETDHLGQIPEPETYATATSNAGTGRRNLLSLIDPRKTWRFRQALLNTQSRYTSTQIGKIQQFPAGNPASAVAYLPTSSSTFQETQISDAVESLADLQRQHAEQHQRVDQPLTFLPLRGSPARSSKSPAKSNPFSSPLPSTSPLSPRSPTHGGPARRDGFVPDPMDVVPDSEPLQDDNKTNDRNKLVSRHSASPKKRKTESNHSRRREFISNVTSTPEEANESEIDDSNTTKTTKDLSEEDEDDVPLAAVAASRSRPNTRQELYPLLTNVVPEARTASIPRLRNAYDDPIMGPTNFIRHKPHRQLSKPIAITKDKGKGTKEAEYECEGTPAAESKRGSPATGKSATGKLKAATGYTGKVGPTNKPIEVEIPSSVPEQDTRQKVIIPKIEYKKPFTPKARPAAVSKAAKQRYGSKMKREVSGRAKRRRVDSEEEGTSSSSPEVPSSSADESDGGLLLAQVKEEQTALLDEGYSDPDCDIPTLASRKRKRVTKTSVSMTSKTKVLAKTTPVSARSSKIASSDIGAGGSKRLRHGTYNSPSQSLNVNPTRVFALWRADGYYYPGTVDRIEGKDYMIDFDDGNNLAVPIEHMRRCILRKGDEVLVATYKRSCKVVDAARVDDRVQRTVKVMLQGSSEDVELAAVRLAARTVAAWKDRSIGAEEIIPRVGTHSPSPSKASPGRGPKNKNLFAGMGLVVSLSNVDTGETERPQDRHKRIEKLIEANGGTVLTDWNAVFRMEGKYTTSRYVATQNDIKWKEKSKVERTFLLCDQPSQKPKFLIALALGIPCLSLSWLSDSIENDDEQPWVEYLVDQGWCSTLNTSITQQVDKGWGTSSLHLEEIQTNSVPAKPFKGKSVLCYGQDVFPSNKKKSMNESANAITQIILCMGAEHLEAVVELRQATRKAINYDLIIVKDPSLRMPAFSGCTVVTWEWVKECLSASRLLVVPDHH